MKVMNRARRASMGGAARNALRGVAVALVIIMLCGTALADDPVVVRVGDFSYARSVVQGSLDSALELSEMLRGDAPSEEEKEARLQSTVDSFVQLGVIECKLDEQ